MGARAARRVWPCKTRRSRTPFMPTVPAGGGGGVHVLKICLNSEMFSRFEIFKFGDGISGYENKFYKIQNFPCMSVNIYDKFQDIFF